MGPPNGRWVGSVGGGVWQRGRWWGYSQHGVTTASRIVIRPRGMGCAVDGVRVGILASSFLGCHHRDGVSVLADRGRVLVRVLLRIVSG